MAYGDFKDLTRRTASDKILFHKAFNIAKNPKYGRYQCDLASMVYKFCDKRTSDSGTKNKNISNKELAEELHKPIVRKLKKKQVHSPFLDNTRRSDLAYMQLRSKFNQGFEFLLCVIGIHSKYAWVISFKDKKGITITTAYMGR